MSDAKPTVQAEEAARKNLALLRDLQECAGFRLWLLPRLKAVRGTLEARVLGGMCTDHGDYLATVRMLTELDAEVFIPLDNDEARHTAMLAKR